MIAPARPTSAAPRPQPSANTLFLSIPTSATAPASSRVASRARPKSVRLMKKYSAPKAAIDTSAPASCGTGMKIPPTETVLPVPQLAGALVSIAAFGALYFFINRTDFGRALEATREDAGAVALVGIDKNKVFALGWGLGAALVGLAGAIMAMFFYIYPDVGASFALIAYVTVALGGFGSVFGAFAGGIIVGLVEATTALILPPSLKSVGIYAVYLLVVFVRPRGLFGSI